MKFKIIRMVFADLIVKEMCLWNTGIQPVESGGCMEHSLKNTELQEQ